MRLSTELQSLSNLIYVLFLITWVHIYWSVSAVLSMLSQWCFHSSGFM